MIKEKKILMNYLLYILAFFGICIVGISNIFADAITTQDVTWYYRQMSNENNMLSTVKSIDSYINLVANGTNNQEYLNGYTTRISSTFHKDAQYNLNYTLTMQYSEAIDSMFRSDTVSRLKNYSYVDSDFTLISSTVDQITYKCQNSQCFRVFSISLSMKANTNTSAVRFGVYTTNNISIGFYDHLGGSSYQSTVSMILSNTTSLNENGDSVIIGQNETIINQNNQAMEEARENTQNIINNQNSNNQNLIDNQEQNTQDIINNNNQNTQDIINSNKVCETIDKSDIVLDNTQLTSNGGTTTNNNTGITDYINIQNATIEKLTSYGAEGYLNRTCFYDSSKTYISCYGSTGIYDIEIPSNAYYFRATIVKSTNTPTYKICKNGNNALNDSIKEQNKTSKGILGKLGEVFNVLNPFSEDFFGYKIIQLLTDALKALFIPSNTFLTNWFNDLKQWIEQKFGILSAPFTIFINFVQLYLTLEEQEIIINIPQITVPNFEETILIQTQSFNWGELLRSKPAFLNMWNLYLDFIDVFLILNFLGLCETTYNRIFGGDTSQYEYYTTEETYNINDDTGEATNHMLRQRRTRRERV